MKRASITALAIAAACLAGLGGLAAVGGETSESALPNPLSVDATNPVIYINDQSTDNYNGELVLAMADKGIIDLRGFIVGYPREPWMKERKYEVAKDEYITHHHEVRAKAEESGFSNLPPAELGVFAHQEKPVSGVIEDTAAIGSPGTDLIVEEALKATRERPLVIVAGGDLCTVADAYLTNPAIADSVVVYWHEQVADINKQAGYNLQNSGWAAYIVLSRLPTALDGEQGSPRITEEQVRRDVPSPLREYMLTKQHWQYGLPLRKGYRHDGDAKAVILATFPETRGPTRFHKVAGQAPAKWFKDALLLPRLEESEAPTHIVEISEIYHSTEKWREIWH